jgi:hypothetical protein
LITPTSTTAMRSSGSMRMIRFKRFSVMTIPSATGSDPPERLVPLPRATKGTCISWQILTSAMTSSCVSGTATASGVARNAVRPSLS